MIVERWRLERGLGMEMGKLSCSRIPYTHKLFDILFAGYVLELRRVWTSSPKSLLFFLLESIINQYNKRSDFYLSGKIFLRSKFESRRQGNMFRNKECVCTGNLRILIILSHLQVYIKNSDVVRAIIKKFHWELIYFPLDLIRAFTIGTSSHPCGQRLHRRQLQGEGWRCYAVARGAGIAALQLALESVPISF